VTIGSATGPSAGSRYLDASSCEGIGQRLKRIRDNLLLTQAELSERSRVPLATIKDIERGATQRPRNATLKALASALGVHPLQLLQGTERVDGNWPGGVS
jgi:transcriptional regulator with XRE-family HTH domain